MGAALGASALGTAGAVLGAGAAGYGAGRLIDNTADLIGETITGNDKGDYSLSNLWADQMAWMDEGATGVMRDLGVCDDDAPAYTQTVGWQLASMLDGW